MRSPRLALAGGLLAIGALLPGTASAALGTQVTWAGTQIHLYDAFHAGYDGRGVTVAVLDGWIDVTHPDFQGRAVQSADCTSGTCTTAMGKDHCGSDHGTHVAGTVASSSYGVARRAKLLAIRVLKADGADCAGTPTAVAAGIHWAITQHAQVLNLSLGPDLAQKNVVLDQAVSDAANAGLVVVFSAGNNSTASTASYGSDALIVAATGPSGHLATYSQHGDGVSVAAPGGQPTSADQCTQARCITSLYPANRYAVAAGTSMAAPHVAGLAALLLQKNPSWSRTQVMNRITGTAHALSGAGSGLIDVRAALGVRSTTPKPTATPRRTTSPRPKPKPTPTQTTPRTATSPSPVVIMPSPTPSATLPSPTPTPVSSSPPAVAEPSSSTTDDQVPLPLAGVAGALVGLAGTAVLLQVLRR